MQKKRYSNVMCRLANTAILLCLLFTYSCFAENTNFQKGLEAFNLNEYDIALHYFKQAESEQATDNTYYYLATTYYALQQYSFSENYFKRLSLYPARKPLAVYHLGLVAQKKQQPSRARSYFTHIVETSNDDELVRAARKQLKSINANGRKSTSKKRWLIYSKHNFGHNDNIAFDNRIDSSENQNVLLDDEYHQTTLYTEARLNSNEKEPLKVIGLFYDQDYRENNEYNIRLGEIKLNKKFIIMGYDFIPEISIQDIRYGGSNYLQAKKAGFSINEYKKNSAYKVAYYYYQYDPADEYDYLDGNMQELALEYKHLISKKNSLALAYTYQYNERNDFTSGNVFVSYSPIKYRLNGTLEYHFLKNFSLLAAYEYERSRYRDVNSFFDNSTNVLIQRKDKSDQYKLTLRYNYRQRCKTELSLKKINNDSTIQENSYRQNVGELSFDCFF